MTSAPTVRTIEQICSVAGSRPLVVPELPSGSTPNLDAIKHIYEFAFAPGLDKFVESTQAQWYAKEGFRHLVSNRQLLGQFLAYLTLASNNGDLSLSDNPALASQEARITSQLLGLCVGTEHDGGEEAEKLTRRVKAVEALLTGEKMQDTALTSLADFVHQDEPEPEPVQPQARAFERQLTRRSEDFWKAIEKSASSDPSDTTSVTQTKKWLNQLENRDIIYSILVLRSTAPGHVSAQERDLAKRFLEQVFGTIAGMALRAFER